METNKGVTAGKAATKETPKAPAGRVTYRELLRNIIFLCCGAFFVWLEQTLILLVCISLVVFVVALIWLAVVTAFSTSFVWLPIVFVSLPLLITAGILLRFTRLQEMLRCAWSNVNADPLKSRIWTQGILTLATK